MPLMPQFCLEGLSGPIEIAYIFGGRNYNMMRKEVVLSPKEGVLSGDGIVPSWDCP